MKNRGELLTLIVVIIWAIILAIDVYVNFHDTAEMAIWGFAIDIVFLLLFVVLSNSKSFRTWAKKPLKKDNEK